MSDYITALARNQPEDTTIFGTIAAFAARSGYTKHL
jgi:hypothetical protein